MTEFFACPVFPLKNLANHPSSSILNPVLQIKLAFWVANGVQGALFSVRPSICCPVLAKQYVSLQHANIFRLFFYFILRFLSRSLKE